MEQDMSDPAYEVETTHERWHKVYIRADRMRELIIAEAVRVSGRPPNEISRINYSQERRSTDGVNGISLTVFVGFTEQLP